MDFLLIICVLIIIYFVGKWCLDDSFHGGGGGHGGHMGHGGHGGYHGGHSWGYGGGWGGGNGLWYGYAGIPALDDSLCYYDANGNLICPPPGYFNS